MYGHSGWCNDDSYCRCEHLIDAFIPHDSQNWDWWIVYNLLYRHLKYVPYTFFSVSLWHLQLNSQNLHDFCTIGCGMASTNTYVNVTFDQWGCYSANSVHKRVNRYIKKLKR